MLPAVAAEGPVARRTRCADTRAMVVTARRVFVTVCRRSVTCAIAEIQLDESLSRDKWRTVYSAVVTGELVRAV